MQRLTRPFTAIAVLAAIAAPASSTLPRVIAGAAASQSTALAVQATPTSLHPTTGKAAGLFVHAPAFSQLTLAVGYAGGVQERYQGSTDGRGRYVFAWAVPSDPRQAGMATLSLQAQRGAQQGRWSGTLAVGRAPLPSLFVKPLAASYVAGNSLSIFVGSAPFAAVTYRLVAADRTVVDQGTGATDAQGRYVIVASDSYLPRARLAVTASITVTTDAGSRTRTTRFLLLPRPPLPLKVTEQATRAGEPFSVIVRSKPHTAISLSVLLGATVLARESGATDAAGELRYSTILNLTLKQAGMVRVLVKAGAGVDTATRSVRVRLGPSKPGIYDRLATSVDPTPNVGRYLSTIPDKLVLVSTEGQTLREYDHGVLVHEGYVTTGRPELPTVHGVFHVYEKVTPFTFISPWAYGSAFYYPPSPVRYWMPFYQGYGLHDAPWRSIYGPGTNLPHASDPGEPVGSHGCVNIPLQDMIWLWNWAQVGTTVVVT